MSYAQNSELDSLSDLLKREVSEKSRIDILNALAFQYIYVDPSVAKDDVNIALRRSKELEYAMGEAEALKVLGGINWAKANYAVALDYYISAAEIYEAQGEKLGLSKCLNNIGEIYNRLDEPDKALEYHLQSLSIKEKLIGKEFPLMSHINIANIYLDKQDYDSAAFYFNLILRYREKSDERKLSYAYMGLGDVAFRQNKLEKAKDLYFKSFWISKKRGDRRNEAYIYNRLGELYTSLNILDSADFYFDNALDVAYALKAKDLSMQALLGKTLVDSTRNDFKSALNHYWLYTAYKDSTFNEEKSNQIARMQTEYETALLKKQNEANKIKVKQQQIVVIGAILALMFVGVLAYVLYRQRMIQKRANKLLENKNEEIQSRNKEIERKSRQLEELNQTLEELNAGLEEKVKTRTTILRKQNEVLSQYAFTNAHELRAPVANILGLIELLRKSELKEREPEIVEHLKKATAELDRVISNIRQRLENEEVLEL
ncbi:MAG: tetratricopeptide repeat protein [Fulvivirga sp.]|nr:tetratricopeptide repeat protein [Fulvivirga sp.]